MDLLEEEWREIDTEDMSIEDIMIFFKEVFTFNVNLNSKDHKTQNWIKNHSVWILPKKSGK